MKIAELLITASLEQLYRQAPYEAKRHAEHLLELLNLMEDGDTAFLNGHNRVNELKLTVEEVERYRKAYQVHGLYALLPKEYRKQKPIIEISKLVNNEDPTDMSLHLVCRSTDGSFVVCRKLEKSHGEYSHEWEHGRYFQPDEFASALRCFYQRSIELGFIANWEADYENQI